MESDKKTYQKSERNYSNQSADKSRREFDNTHGYNDDADAVRKQGGRRGKPAKRSQDV